MESEAREKGLNKAQQAKHLVDPGVIPGIIKGPLSATRRCPEHYCLWSENERKWRGREEGKKKETDRNRRQRDRDNRDRESDKDRDRENIIRVCWGRGLFITT